MLYYYAWLKRKTPFTRHKQLSDRLQPVGQKGCIVYTIIQTVVNPVVQSF